MNPMMATRGIFLKTFSPSTRSTESSLKTSQANFGRTRKFPRSWRCRLDLTWLLLDRRRTDISAYLLPSRRVSERFLTWISAKLTAGESTQRSTCADRGCARAAKCLVNNSQAAPFPGPARSRLSLLPAIYYFLTTIKEYLTQFP